MKLEQQVCSLDLAKQLKELGVKQESLFYWLVVIDNYYIEPEIVRGKPEHKNGYYQKNEKDPWQEIGYSAFTVAELGEMLPERITIDGEYAFISCPYYESPLGYRCWIEPVRGAPSAIQPGDNEPSLKTEADARAKMLIYLLENNLLP